MDRFEIDLELNISTNFTVRTTYFGKHRLSQFDLSFKLEGECGENYYGPLCDRFCQGGGELSCDSQGNRICANSSGLDPTTNCTTCLVMGREVANNCKEVPTTGNLLSLSYWVWYWRSAYDGVLTGDALCMNFLNSSGSVACMGLSLLLKPEDS